MRSGGASDHLGKLSLLFIIGAARPQLLQLGYDALQVCVFLYSTAAACAAGRFCASASVRLQRTEGSATSTAHIREGRKVLAPLEQMIQQLLGTELRLLLCLHEALQLCQGSAQKSAVCSAYVPQPLGLSWAEADSYDCKNSLWQRHMCTGDCTLPESAQSRA